MLSKDIKTVPRKWKRAAALAAVLCVIYVMLFPAVQLCAYFEIIDLNSWVGDVALFVFWPLFWLNDASSTAHQFFVWLGELYASPFTNRVQEAMKHNAC